MDRTLKQHENMIEHHEVKLEDIQKDLADVKVRLGIKDKTNGQVIDYQKQLVDAQNKEREDRKEQDQKMFEYLAKLDERIWYLAVGIGVSVLLEIGVLLLQSHL